MLNLISTNILNNKFLSKKSLNFLLISLSLLYLAIHRHINPYNKQLLKDILTNPLIFIGLLIGNIYIIWVNLSLGVLISICFIATICYNKSDDNILQEQYETFKNRKKDNEKRKHHLLKHLDIDPDKVSNAIYDGMRENRIENIKKSLKKKKEKSNNNSNNKNPTNVIIKKRRFDIDNEMDSNLLDTKEILKDIINRIDYEYEDNEYLLKYITNRLEEIVDINNLMDDDS